MQSRHVRSAIYLLGSAIVVSIALLSSAHAPLSVSVDVSSSAAEAPALSTLPMVSAVALKDVVPRVSAAQSERVQDTAKTWQSWLMEAPTAGFSRFQKNSTSDESTGAQKTATKYPTVFHLRRKLPEIAEVQSKARGRVFAAGQKLALKDLPESRLKEQIRALPEAAAETALAGLSSVTFHLSDVAALNADSRGGIFYACAIPEGLRAAPPLPAPAPSAGSRDVILSAPPIYHSKPGASRVILLDFDGHVVTGTAWNSGQGSSPTYNALPFDTDGTPSSFSSAEQTAIQLVWQRVAEDYAPFDVDVTTEQPATMTPTCGRVLITRNTDANNIACRPPAPVASHT